MITLVAWTEYDPSGQIGPSLELDIDARTEKDIEAAKLLAALIKDKFFAVVLYDENENKIYDADDPR
jgi:hypothetical protein